MRMCCSASPEDGRETTPLHNVTPKSETKSADEAGTGWLKSGWVSGSKHQRGSSACKDELVAAICAAVVDGLDYVHEVRAGFNID